MTTITTIIAFLALSLSQDPDPNRHSWGFRVEMDPWGDEVQGENPIDVQWLGGAGWTTPGEPGSFGAIDTQIRVTLEPKPWGPPVGRGVVQLFTMGNGCNVELLGVSDFPAGGTYEIELVWGPYEQQLGGFSKWTWPVHDDDWNGTYLEFVARSNCPWIMVSDPEKPSDRTSGRVHGDWQPFTGWRAAGGAGFDVV